MNYTIISIFKSLDKLEVETIQAENNYIAPKTILLVAEIDET